MAICCNTAVSFAYDISPIRLFSPDKHIVYEFEIRKGIPGFDISFQGKKLMDFSVLNLVFKGDSLLQGVRLIKSIRMDSAERYTLLTGRSGSVNDSFRQISLFVKEIHAPAREIMIQVRAFNDGVAFRYQYLGSAADSLFLVQEKSGFQIRGNPFVHALVQDNFHNSHEGNYLRRYYKDLPADSLLDLPLLFEYPDSLFLAITEASLLDYAGM